MAQWTGLERHYPDGSELVAEVTLTHNELDLLTAFYEQVTSPEEGAELAVRDLIELSRLFAMIADAADWTDEDTEELND